MRKLMLLVLGTELQFVDMVDDLPQVVARLNLVLDFAENFTDLVFDRIRSRRLLLEAVQVGDQLVVDEVPEVITGLRLVVVDLAIFVLRRRPHIPAVLLLEDVLVFFPLHRGFVGFVLLQAVEILQEQQPGSLLDVVQFGRATGLFPEHIVDILECLFKHGFPSESRSIVVVRYRIALTPMTGFGTIVR